MKLPTIPELEELPVDQRESFLRRCDDTPAMQRFRSRAQFFRRASVFCAAMIPILLGEFVFRWHMGVSLGIAIPLTLGALYGSSYLCFRWQIRIIRQLLRAQFGGHPAA